MNLIQKLAAKLLRLQPPAPQKQFIVRDTIDLRLAEFRKNQSLVDAARKLANDKAYRLAIQVLQNEHPRHSVLALGVSPNDRIVHQARIEGYEMALNNLDALQTPLATHERLESTFEPEPTK